MLTSGRDFCPFEPCRQRFVSLAPKFQDVRGKVATAHAEMRSCLHKYKSEFTYTNMCICMYIRKNLWAYTGNMHTQCSGATKDGADEYSWMLVYA
jgi:hypothetical protein